MSLVDELNKSVEESDSQSVKEIPEGTYMGVTEKWELAPSKFHKKMVLRGFIKLDDGAGRPISNIDLLSPSGRAGAIKTIGSLVSTHFTTMPKFISDGTDDLVVLQKLGELLSGGVRVSVQIVHKKDSDGEKKVSDTGYTGNWVNFVALPEGESKIDADKSADAIPF